MSEQVIDERVVSMKFDNEEFEKKSAQSLSTIQKLKQALNFKDTVKSLDNLEKASKSVDLSHIGNSVDAIKEKFNGWEVAARTAIMNITNSAVNSAKRIVSSLTIDPVKTGMGIYEQKLSSVQTMLNNSGEGLGKVTEVLDDLNAYSDKTIFSLNDMTTALGKFTAQGVDLEKAARIIKGAANEAATMGAGSAEFSRFIYNLTQAYGMGKMTTIDWKSLENAGVAGREFKEQLIESAKVLGTIDEKGMYKGQLVTTANLREFLKDGIITADVMTDTFEKYAGVKEGFEDFGAKALSAAQDVKTFHQLLDVLAESVSSTWSQSFGYIIGDFYEAKNLWTNVSKIFDQTVGKMNENRNKLLKAWHDGFIDPALNSKYSVEELRESLDAGLGDPRKISGRKLLLDGLANAFQAILQVIKPVKDAFQEIFPATTARNLWEATKNFRDFTANLKLSEGALRQIKDAATGVFTVLKFFRDTIKDLIGALIPATKNTDSLLSVVLGLVGALGRLATSIVTSIKNSEAYSEVLSTISFYANGLIKIVATILKTLFGIGKVIKDTGALQFIVSKLASGLQVILGIITRLGPVAVLVFKGIVSAIIMGVGYLGKGVSAIVNFFQSAFGKEGTFRSLGENIVAGLVVGISSAANAVGKAVTFLANLVTGTFKKEEGIHSPSAVFIALGGFIVAGLVIGLLSKTNLLASAVGGIGKVLASIGTGVKGVFLKIKEAVIGTENESNKLETIVKNVANKIGESSKGLIDKIGQGLSTLVGFLSKLNWAAVVTIGIVGTLLAGVIKIIATFYKLGDAVNTGVKAANNITKGFKNFSKAFKRMHSPLVETLKGIAICVMGITASMWLLATLEDTGKLYDSMASLLASLLGVLTIATIAAAISHKYDLTDDMKNLALMVLAISGSFLLMGITFSNIIAVLQESEADWPLITQALAVLGGMAVIMMATAAVINRFSKEGSVKAIISMLVWTFSLTKVIDAIKELMKNGKGLTDDDLKGLWLGGIAPMFVMMLGIAAIGAAFKNVGVGSTLFILTMIYACKTIFDSVKDLKVSVDPALIKWLNDPVTDLKDLMVAILIGLGVLAGLMALLLGPKIEALGKGLIMVTLAIAGMMGVAKMAQKLEIKNEDMQKAIGAAVMVGALCLALAVLAWASKDSNLHGVTGVVLGIAAIILSISYLSKQVTGLNDDSMLYLVGILAEIIFGLVALLFALSLIKDVKTGPVVALMGAILIIIGGLSILSTIPDMNKLWTAATSLSLVMAALAASILAMSRLKDINKGPVIALAGIILILVGSLIALTVIEKDTDKIFKVSASLSLIMASLAAVFLAMSRITNVKVGPIVAMTVAIGVLAGALFVLTKYTDYTTLIYTAATLSLVMIVFAGCIKTMNNVNIKALGAMITMTVAIGVIAGSLWMLSNYGDMSTILDAVLAISSVLLVLAASMKLMNGVNFEAVGGMIVGVVAIAVIAGALWFLTNYADWNGMIQAATALSAVLLILAIAIGIISTNSWQNALGAAGAILIVSGALIILTMALQMMKDIDWTQIGQMSVALLVVAGVLVVLGIIGAAVGVGMVAAAAGFVLMSVGIVAISAALLLLGQVDPRVLRSSTLVGLAEGIVSLGVAGIVAGLGGIGLIIGAAGIGAMALALGYLSSKVSLTGEELVAIADGLKAIAAAGILGIFGGVGLIVLAAGIGAIAITLYLVAKAFETIAVIVEAIANSRFVKLIADFVERGKNMLQGFMDGIKSFTGKVKEKVTNLADKVLGWFKKRVGDHSPWDSMIESGKHALMGLIEGITDTNLTDLLQKAAEGLGIDGILNPLKDTLGGGIGDILKGFTKMFNKKAGHMERQWNFQKGMYEDVWVEDDTFGLDSIFDKLGFSGTDSLGDYFKELNFNVGDYTSAADGAGISTEDLTGALGDLGTQTGDTNKSFKDSVNALSEYKRSLTVTVKDIQNNLLQNVIGQEEWRSRLNNLIAIYGQVAPNLVKQIKDMGMEQGSQYAAALISAATNKNEFDKIVKYYGEANGEIAANIDKLYEIIDGGAKAMAKSGIEVEKTVEMMNGSYNKINPEYDSSFWNDVKDSSHNDAMSTLYQIEKDGKTLQENIEASYSEVKEAIDKGDVSMADSAIQSMSESIKTALNNYLPANAFAPIGENITVGLASGMLLNWKSKDPNVNPIATAQELANAIIDRFMKATDEHSPSKVFMKLGEFIDEGLALGIGSGESEKSTKDLGDTLLDLMRSQIDQILYLMNMDEEFSPVIRPVVDFSNINGAGQRIQTMLDGTNVSLASMDFSNLKAAQFALPSGMMSMSKDEFRTLMASFAEAIVEGINSDNSTPVEVNVNLEGDAAGIFKLVREENNQFKRTAGYSGLI